MKEDILEQMAEDFYLAQPGYFTKTNIKYKPDEKRNDFISENDSVHSDIDVLAFNPNKKLIEVVNCKAWQTGINFTQFVTEIENTITNQPPKPVGERPYWTHFRELGIIKWTDGFLKKIREETNSTEKLNIKYNLLCLKLTNKGTDNEYKANLKKIKKIIQGYFYKIDNKVEVEFIIKIIDDIVIELIDGLINKNKTAVENTHLARTFQLLLASNHVIIKKNRLEYSSLTPSVCSECKQVITSGKIFYLCNQDYYQSHEVFCQNCYFKKNKPVCSICSNKLINKHF